jgi:hypothetical protein
MRRQKPDRPARHYRTELIAQHGDGYGDLETIPAELRWRIRALAHVVLARLEAGDLAGAKQALRDGLDAIEATS